jgi:hypothetical protein
MSASQSSPRPPWGRRILLSGGLILTFSGVGFALLGVPTVVYDPKVETTMNAWYAKMESSAAAQHFKELTELLNQVQLQKDQIAQFTDWQGYMRKIHGVWDEKIAVPDFTRTKNVQIGAISLQSIGWGNLDEWRNGAATRGAADALEQMREILNAQRPAIELRETLETVYGDTPVTQNGAAVESARRQMGESIAYSGELRRALAEKQSVIEALKQEIASGELPPGDLERKMVLLQAEQIDVQLLLAQTVNQSNQLTVQQLGLQSQAAGNAEMQRLSERENRLRMMQSSLFGMGRAAEAPEVQ